MGDQNQLIQFGDDGIAECKPSRASRVIYAVSYRFTRPLVRWLVSDGKRPVAEQLTILGSRINRLARLQRLSPLRGLYVERGEVDGMPMEIVRPYSANQPVNEGVVLYLHGGGFFLGGLDTHRHVVARIARLTGLPVMHIEYGQYPNATINEGVDDCCGVYQWLLEHGANPAKTILAGDSAGGFLAYATALRTQQYGLPRAAGVIGLSPLLELDGTARSSYSVADQDAFGVPFILPTLAKYVYPEIATINDPSAINGPLEKMPPSLLIAAETEILRCDAERLHSALIESGRSSVLQMWPKQLHAFPALLPFLPESHHAFDSISQFIRSCVAAASALPNDQGGAM